MWGVAAYLAVGAAMIVLTATRATWGGLVLGPMLVGLLALLAHAAIGFALGWYLPSRFTAPLVAIGLFFAQSFIGAGVIRSIRPQAYPRFGWVEFLSPTAPLDASVWYGVRPDLGPPRALFLLGLTGLALGSLALRDRRSLVSWAVLPAAGLLTAVGMALIADNAPYGGIVALRSMHNGRPVVESTLIPYEPVCSADPLPVCVHPAYQRWLRDNAALINRIAAPVLGLPGAPPRAEQLPPPFRPSGEVLVVTPSGRLDDSRSNAAATIALGLVQDPTVAQVPRTYRGPLRSACLSNRAAGCVEAQWAVALWLLEQAGVPIDSAEINSARFGDFYGADWGAVAAATRRFAALDPARQREWLQAHYADLRGGKVGLEELP